MNRERETQGADDRTLVERYLRERSEGAFRSLYRAHTPYLHCLALRLAGGRADEAEEAVQEAWIRAVQRLEGFAGRSRLRTWLAGFVVNCCRELRRRRPATDSSPRPEPVQAPVDGARLDVERLLAALPDGQREVLVLFELEGYTHDEIATALAIAPGTSKSRLFEARRTLRRRLDPTAEEAGG